MIYCTKPERSTDLNRGLNPSYDRHLFVLTFKFSLTDIYLFEMSLFLIIISCTSVMTCSPWPVEKVEGKMTMFWRFSIGHSSGAPTFWNSKTKLVNLPPPFNYSWILWSFSLDMECTIPISFSFRDRDKMKYQNIKEILFEGVCFSVTSLIQIHHIHTTLHILIQYYIQVIVSKGLNI